MILTKNTADLRQRVTEHVAADRVVQGQYWEENRGCFIGCLNHSSNPAGAESEFGLPIVVQRIAESIFEALPADEAKAFFAALPDAVHSDGMDLSRVGWKLLAAELRSLPEQSDEIQAVIDRVIAGMDLLAAGQEWPDAIAAAYAANAAAHAANAAANAAAIAANAAAHAANAAAHAANAAAKAAAYTAKAAAYTAINAADAAAYTAKEAAYAAINAADAADAAIDAAADTLNARRRQRDLLLWLIAEYPIPGDNQ